MSNGLPEKVKRQASLIQSNPKQPQATPSNREAPQMRRFSFCVYHYNSAVTDCPVFLIPTNKQIATQKLVLLPPVRGSRLERFLPHSCAVCPRTGGKIPAFVLL